MGGLYSLQDILARIAEGRMQSWVEGDSWVITQISVFPRARVLEIVIALGKLDEVLRIHERLIDFAKEIDVGVIQAYGRKGWLPFARERGWKVKARSFVYAKEL